MTLALIAALIATFHVSYALDSFDETKPVEMVALDHRRGWDHPGSHCVREVDGG